MKVNGHLLLLRLSYFVFHTPNYLISGIIKAHSVFQIDVRFILKRKHEWEGGTRKTLARNFIAICHLIAFLIVITLSITAFNLISTQIKSHNMVQS